MPFLTGWLAGKRCTMTAWKLSYIGNESMSSATHTVHDLGVKKKKTWVVPECGWFWMFTVTCINLIINVKLPVHFRGLKDYNLL